MIRRRRTTRTAAAAAAIAAAIAVGTAPGAARGANQTVHVTNRADDGSPTSLRAAIDQVNASPGDHWTIRLDPGAPYVIDRACTDGDTDDNHGGDLDVVTSASLQILGTSDSSRATIEVRCTGERAIDVSGGGTLRLVSVRITGGNAPAGANGVQAGDLDGTTAEAGGAVRSTGRVEVIDSLLDGNSTGRGGSGAPPLFAAAGGDAGSGGAGGAIRASEIVVRSSTITGNRTGDGGAGGNAIGAGNAGGSGGSGGNGTLWAVNSVVVVSSVISGNATGSGGTGGHGLSGAGGAGGTGGSGGAIYVPRVEMALSSVVGNVAGDGGAGGTGTTTGGTGGRGGYGGGVWAEVGQIETSTIVGNSAGAGGPGGAAPVAGPSGDTGRGGGIRTVPGPGLELSFVTVTGNAAGLGANLAMPPATPVFASIIGDAAQGADCDAAITSLGRNAFGGGGCGHVATDLVLGGPLPLGPLGHNGGTTLQHLYGAAVGDPLPTRMPLAGSPLEGLVPAADCAAIGADQRHEPRPSGGCEPGAVEAPPSGASSYVPLPPQRVFDTRQPGPLAGAVAAGGTITVPFTGVAGVPLGATAVALNLTITQAGGAGYVTAYPAGAAQPLASNLNTVRAGQDVANLVIVPLGAGGAISFFSDGGGHLLADVAGYFVAAQASAAGRIVPMAPQRVFDTRQPGPLQGVVGAGQSITVGFNDLPAQAAAVVLNVTATQAERAGYVTVFPGGIAQPYTSTLNLTGPGHTAASTAIVPLGTDRTVELFSDGGAHLLADITGYVTGPTAPVASSGLTVPMEPVRVFDTRPGPAIPAGGSIQVPTAGTVGIPADAAAVLLNVTAANATGPGYVTGWPTDRPQPLASILNVTELDETRANAAIMPVGEDGGIAYFSDNGTHLLADAFGYLLPVASALYPV